MALEISAQHAQENLLWAINAADKLRSWSVHHWPQEPPCEDECWIGNDRKWTWLNEPWQEDEQLRFLNVEVAKHLAHLLNVRGVYVHHEPDSGQLKLMYFERGEPTLVWCDSCTPGDSVALTFHEDGSCTQEDPRLYALRALNLPMDTATLDRYAFFEFLLHTHGVHISPPMLKERISFDWVLRPCTCQSNL